MDGGACPLIADIQKLDELLEIRSATVRIHDAEPSAGNRTALVDAAVAYRRAQGWGADRIADDIASINNRLNRVFGNQHHE